MCLSVTVTVSSDTLFNTLGLGTPMGSLFLVW